MDSMTVKSPSPLVNSCMAECVVVHILYVEQLCQHGKYSGLFLSPDQSLIR